MAQLVSASPCHGEGRGFESRQGRNGVPVVDRRPGQVAQLVERPPEKRKVAGSTPALATVIKFQKDLPFLGRSFSYAWGRSRVSSDETVVALRPSGLRLLSSVIRSW